MSARDEFAGQTLGALVGLPHFGRDVDGAGQRGQDAEAEGHALLDVGDHSLPGILAEIEQHILTLGVPATILRPVFFMNNLLHYADAAGERLLALPVKPDKPMQLIATDDIGVFAADAFDHPAQFIGRQLELAGDELTFPEVAEIYERVTGTPTRFEALPIDERMFESCRLAREGKPGPTIRRARAGAFQVSRRR
ncbi:NmrA family NAD(P)-binding protein [Nonomuraea sp. GTA35]|uniref:NmrA family NAD(P)-binding protein n=1 Tax=Nonomuraea sp. GTA35 TaxID=1676746 RepID=UPI0035C0524A